MEFQFDLTKEEIIKYRIERAFETIEDAKLLANDNRWNTTVNRLYYASFYAVIGLFAQKGIRTKSHSGALTMFSKEFIKTGIVSQKQGDLYTTLFNKRQESDYKDFQVFTQEDIEHLIPETEEFIKTIKQIIDNQ